MKIEFEWYFQTCANDTFDEKLAMSKFMVSIVSEIQIEVWVNRV